MKKILLLFLVNSVCFAQQLSIPQIKFSPQKYICYYTNKPLIIDGRLIETAWKKAEWTNDFVDIEGYSKPVPRFRTRVKMLWDSSYLYIAAEIQEPDIWATLRQRDTAIFYDNDFEIFIDPDGDTHRYSEFEMNALNTVWDLLLIKPYRDTWNAAVNDWDIHGLKSSVKINGTLNKPGDKDEGWTVEVAFPWDAFKEITQVSVPPKIKDQWRINFSRVEWKTEVKNGMNMKIINPKTDKPYPEDNWVWSPQGIVNMHYPEMWGYIQFSTDSVGNKIDSFVVRKEEAAKWYLRQIYYKERNYFDSIGTFTTDLKKIGIKEEDIKGFKMPANVECTSDYFEAQLKSLDNSETVLIRNDGRVWIEQSLQNKMLNKKN